MSLNPFIRRAGVSSVALCVAMLGAATAQAQGAANDKGADKEIVVTGIRQSLANALSAKRDSDQVMDAISAEDVGKFPDKNVGEALQRITGVQISRAGGEGSAVSIRGVDPGLIRVEVNGQSQLSSFAGDVAGASTNPAVEFRDIPAEFISRLEVVKSASADMTEGGLGGTVRLITRRPFDSRKDYLAGSIQGVYGTLGHRMDPKSR
jgi:iron complex outermembrane receptor protein